MNALTRWTPPRIRALKGREKVVSVTAYDFFSARLLDEAGVHILLVGDSLGMTVLGYDSTLPVTMNDMLHHTAAVVRGRKQALVVTDLPFLSYQVSDAEAVANAGRCLQVGADAVKIEGGERRAATVAKLVENGIPVMGHIGLLPQNVKAMGGYKVQGRTDAEADQLERDARAIEAAGAFSMVLEGMPAEIAARVSKAVTIPTIGIGAGADCDGQVLVYHDLLGLTPDPAPKFVKRYARLDDEIRNAIRKFSDEVKSGQFPGPEHEY